MKNVHFCNFVFILPAHQKSLTANAKIELQSKTKAIDQVLLYEAKVPNSDRCDAM